MAKLNFSLDGNLLAEFELDKERISIGRRPSSDIHIDNLAVSGEHAIIVTMGNDSFLEDLNSTNGTMVNQKLIKKHVLQHNDLIEFGKYQLKFLANNVAKQKPNDGFANTLLINPIKKQTKLPTPAVVKPPPIAEVTAAPTTLEAENAESIATPQHGQSFGHIQILNGENEGQELLLNRAMFKLGKPGGQLAVITKRPHGYFLTHVEGANFPSVNGESIGMLAHSLNDHDVIELSGVKMEFYLA